MMDAYIFGALGTRWNATTTPTGAELKNAKLEALLTEGQLKLDQAQFEEAKTAGSVPDSTECYIKAGGKLYKPNPGPTVSFLKPNEDLALQVMLPSA